MKKENHFSEKVLEKIKEKKITPKPKWQFLLKDYLVWGLGALALFIGGMAFSVIIYMFIYNDWNVYAQVSNSLLEFVFLTLPYFWIVVLVLFILVVNYNLRHTKKGYRYPVSSILVATIVISVVLGVVFFGAGMGQAIDDALGQKAPFYEKIINRRVQLWDKAQSGFMAGVVNEIISEDSFTLITRSKQEWLISAPAAYLPPEFEVDVGTALKLFGEKSGTSTFNASKILPTGPGRGFFERPKHMFPHMFEMERMHEGALRPRFRPCGMMSNKLKSFEDCSAVKENK